MLLEIQLEIQRNLLEMKMRNQETAAEGRPALLPELRFLLECLLKVCWNPAGDPQLV
jgi:hypothetical protein